MFNYELTILDEVRISLYNILALSWSLTPSGIHLNGEVMLKGLPLSWNNNNNNNNNKVIYL